MADEPTTGWQCPGCGACYSPWTHMCLRCYGGPRIYVTIGGSLAQESNAEAEPSGQERSEP